MFAFGAGHLECNTDSICVLMDSVADGTSTAPTHFFSTGAPSSFVLDWVKSVTDAC
jgi:hypothetical protein